MQGPPESAQPQHALAPPTPQEQALEQAQIALARAQEQTLDFVRKNPIPCVVGGLVAGYLLGRVARSRWLRNGR